MRFVAIDFETANQFSQSACAIGVVVIEDKKIIDSKYWLLCPHESYRSFNYFNTQIHHITYDMVIDELEFSDLYPQFINLITPDTLLVAHNAAFDMRVLRSLFDLYQLDLPDIMYTCTYLNAKKLWNTPNHRLNTLCEYFDINLDHHNALSDAFACAQLFMKQLEENQVSSLYQLLTCNQFHIKTLQQKKKNVL